MSEGCSSCGAPIDARYARCRFCQTAHSADALRASVACPKCGVAVAAGEERCPHCAAWVVVRCLFCEALSPHAAAACGACAEPFAGMIERYQDEERRLATMTPFAREAVRRARHARKSAQRMARGLGAMPPSALPDVAALFAAFTRGDRKGGSGEGKP